MDSNGQENSGVVMLGDNFHVPLTCLCVLLAKALAAFLFWTILVKMFGQ